MVWVGAVFGCDLGAIVSGAIVRVAIADCVDSKDFSAFT